jgi:hypothetical protein
MLRNAYQIPFPKPKSALNPILASYNRLRGMERWTVL